MHDELKKTNKKDSIIYQGEEITFERLVEFLFPSPKHQSFMNEGPDAFDICIADSCFLTEEGKPTFIVRTDKDGKLIKVTDPKKLKLNVL